MHLTFEVLLQQRSLFLEYVCLAKVITYRHLDILTYSHKYIHIQTYINACLYS